MPAGLFCAGGGYDGRAETDAGAGCTGEGMAMSKLCEYCLPGLLVEDHSVPVLLDWRGTSPAELAGVSADDMTLLARESANESPDSAFAGKSISLFYRIVRSP